MQKEILEKYPSRKVRVYAVWFSMLPTDARAGWRWTSRVITDPRVEHFWDGKKVVGRWLAENGDSPGSGVIWDAYFLYGPDAQWEQKPEPLTSWGGPILDEYDELQKNVVPLLAEKSERR